MRRGSIFFDFEMNYLMKMSRSRAKLSSFADSKSFCGGVVLELLADRHSKLYRSLTVENFHFVDTHLILVVRGVSETNRHLYVIIVFEKLPRAEIESDFIEGESDPLARQFLKRLSLGIVSELPGCLVLELKAPLVHLDIVHQPVISDTFGARDESAELTLLMLVDIYGSGNFFLFDNDLPYSRLHHKWSYLVTLDFAKGVMDGEPGSEIVKFFDYNAITGEVVYCTGDPNLTTRCADSVHMSSLRFQSRYSIEQSRAMTLGAYANVNNILCTASGYWIVCADVKIYFYHYETCRVYSIDIYKEVGEANNSITISRSILSAICNADVASDISSVATSLYILIEQTLFRVNWMHESEQLQLSGIHRLSRVLNVKNSTSLVDTLIQDMHIAVEQTLPHADVTLLCLATHSALYMICLEYPRTQYGLRVMYREARYCITLAMPKNRSKLPAWVRFSAPALHCDPTVLTNVYRNKSVYSLTVVGSNNKTVKLTDTSVSMDGDSIWSDVEAHDQRRVQMWLSLFPHLRKESSSSRQVDICPYREGDSPVPFTSIHQHSILRDYLRRQRDAHHEEEEGGEGYEASKERESFSLARGCEATMVSASVRALLQRLENQENVSLETLLQMSFTGSTPHFPLTVQSVAEVLEKVAECAAEDTKGAPALAVPPPSARASPSEAANFISIHSAPLAIWLADLNLTSLLPPAPADSIACLAELGRLVDSILLLDLVQCLRPVVGELEHPDSLETSIPATNRSAALYYDSMSGTGDEGKYLFAPRRDRLDNTLVRSELSTDKTTASAKCLSLDLVLHVILQQQPAQFVDVLYCLLSIEHRNLCLLQNNPMGEPEEPESPLLSLAPASAVSISDKMLPKVKSFRTSLGSATEVNLTPNHHIPHHHHHGQHHQHSNHSEHEEDDDDIFGFGLSRTVLQARHPPTLPSVDINALLHRHRLQGSRNISTTVFDQDGSADEDSDSDSDSGSENSDDMYGIFRDVSDEGASARLHQSVAHQRQSPSGTKEKAVAPRGMTVWAASECLHRAVQPLLPGHNVILSTNATTAANAASTSQSGYVTLLGRCERIARSYLDAHCAQMITTSDGVHQVDALLQVLLLCHQPVLVAQYLLQLRLYEALVAFCQRLAASAAHLWEVAAEAGNAAVSTHPVARYIQAVGGARTSARFAKQSQQQSASARWDAFLDELYALNENNLVDTLSAVLAPLPAETTAGAAGAESVPTAAQVRLVEFIVTLKLTLRCLLARPEGFKDVVGTVLDLIEHRPKIVPLEAMRTWVTAFAVDETEKNRILLSGSLGR